MTYPAAGVPSPSVPSTLSGLRSEIMRVNFSGRDGVAPVCADQPRGKDTSCILISVVVSGLAVQG